MNKQYWITNENQLFQVWYMGYHLADFASNTLAEEYINLKSQPTKWAASLDNMKESDQEAVRGKYNMDNLLSEERLAFSRRGA